MIRRHISPPAPVRHLPWGGEEFAESVKPHLRDALAAAAAVLGCEHHAWDAVQEALLALWREPLPPPNLRAWLLRTVRHRSLHLRRTCCRRRLRDARAAAGRPDCRCEDAPCRILADRELGRLLAEACKRLPAELREVLRLREIEKLDYRAIARRMRAPVGTVRSRLSRARQALKAYAGQALSVSG